MNDVKKKLIDEFINMSQGRNSDEILPLILAVSQKAKQLGVSFSKDETIMFANQLKQNATPAQQNQIDMILQMMM